MFYFKKKVLFILILIMNRVFLIGHLGQDPIVSVFEKGTKVSFSLATSESFKNPQDEWESRSTWHNIVTWDKFLGAKIQMFKKGEKAFIEGQIQTKEYEKEGVKRYFNSIKVLKIEKCVNMAFNVK